MAKKYKCPYCNEKLIRKDLINHINKEHKELIPQNYTSARVVYNLVNKVDHGTCRVCKKPTKWSEKTGRYEVLCANPKCKQHMRDEYKKNMLRVRGTYNILNDPEQQKKMLANRSISGKYKFSDGGIHTYTGTYEQKCLEFMDVVMQIPSKDILSPGPTLEYLYKGEKHFYITDFYYIPYNLIIEVKDGGNNPNTKISPGMKSSREKTIEKEHIITDRGEYNYIRLTDNNFSQLIEVFMLIKDKLLNGDDSKTIRINESQSIIESYFIETNVNNKINTDYKPKGSKLLNNLKKVKITKDNAPKHIRINSNTEGYLFFDNNKLACFVNTEQKPDNTIWIQALEVNKEYQGYSLGTQLLNFAINALHSTHLSVNKNNEVAIKMYKKSGFKIYKKTDKMYFMKTT
jgi:ribosomal protein S18 acetylase RimI-like enzyme